jgi:hypothetical protein
MTRAQHQDFPHRSSVAQVVYWTGYAQGCQGLDFLEGKEILQFSERENGLWDPPSLPFKGTGVIFTVVNRLVREFDLSSLPPSCSAALRN